jgi:hypothetical protein
MFMLLTYFKLIPVMSWDKDQISVFWIYIYNYKYIYIINIHIYLIFPVSLIEGTISPPLYVCDTFVENPFTIHANLFQGLILFNVY